MSEETQVTQETSNLEATPAQNTTTTANTTTDTGKPEGATTTPDDKWEYNGDRSTVPEPFKKYASAFDRYMSTKDQSRAELEKKVKEYEVKLSSIKPAESQPANTGTQPIAEPQVTQEEAEAIMLGDPKTLQKVIQREAKHLLETGVKPQETLMKEKLAALDMRQKEIDAAEVIKSFTEINPDFNELLKSPVGLFMVDAARKGMDIESIYKTAKEIEGHFMTVAETKRKATMDAKRNGSVVGKTISGSPDTVFADNEDHAKRLSIEMTLKGDNRRVQVKDRKR